MRLTLLRTFCFFFKNAGCRLDMPPNLLIRTYFHRGSAWEEVYIGRAIMYPWRSEREVEKGREHFSLSQWKGKGILMLCWQKSFLNLGTVYSLIASLNFQLVYLAQPQIRVKTLKWAHVTPRSSPPSFASSVSLGRFLIICKPKMSSHYSYAFRNRSLAIPGRACIPLSRHSQEDGPTSGSPERNSRLDFLSTVTTGRMGCFQFMRVTLSLQNQPLFTNDRYKQSFGRVERSSFIALPGKRGSQQANAFKTVTLFLGSWKRPYSFKMDNGAKAKD